MLRNSCSRLARKRRFKFELLESRALMAADVLCFHNIEMPEDTDGSGAVTPLDALVVINRLNNAESTADSMSDVDADATTSPLDALLVINFLNRNSSDSSASDTSSAVPASNRIARIEQALAAGTLASKFTLDDAISAIAVLRSGGRPELGDQVIDGVLCRKSDDADRTAELVDKLTTKLTDAGVSDEIITTISTEITDAATAGTPLTLTQIKARLTELGVDVSAIFPAGGKAEGNDRADRFLTHLTDKLTAAGVSDETIATISTEMKDALAAGTPLTITQIKDRLTELGVDVTKIFLDKPEQPKDAGHTDRLIAMLTEKLKAAGVSSDIIATIRTEISDAVSAGTPLTPVEINARLVELGVDTSTIDLQPHGRGRRGR